MANPEHLKILKSGVSHWNEWRSTERPETPDLSRAELNGLDLRRIRFDRVNLSQANLQQVDLYEANLIGADLTGADLSGGMLMLADLEQANLAGANLSFASFSQAHLPSANLTRCDSSDGSFDRADLTRADFTGAALNRADLRGTLFLDTTLIDTDLRQSYFHDTVFSDVNLSRVHHLDRCLHFGPSAVDSRTLERSGTLPLLFLRGVGFSDIAISLIPELSKGRDLPQAVLSHSRSDQDFANLLLAGLQARGVRCWKDPEPIAVGKGIFETSDPGVHLSSKVVMVCSKTFLESDWAQLWWHRAVENEFKLRKSEGAERQSIILVDLDGYVFSTSFNSSIKPDMLARKVVDFTGRKSPSRLERALDETVTILRSTV